MKDLTAGPPTKQMLELAGMLMTNMLAGKLLSIVNMFWLGQLGPEAQAAVTLAVNPVAMMMAVAPITSVGARVLISHAVGGKCRELACRVFNEAFGVVLFASISIALVASCARAEVAAWLSPDPRTAEFISAFFGWYVLAGALQIPLALMAAGLGGTGDVRPGSVAQMGSVALNIVVAPVLIFGWMGVPALGIAGAGLAALISVGCAVAALSWYLLRSGTYLQLLPRLWLSRPTILWRLLAIGLPTGLQTAASAGCMLVFTLLLRPFGPVEQAAFGIGQRMYQFALLPILALGSAATLIAGQNFGARAFDRVYASFKTHLSLGILIAPVLWALAQLYARTAAAWFSDDPAVIEATAHFLRIMSYSLFPMGVLSASNAVLTAFGNTLAVLITAAGSYLLGTILPAWALSQLPGFNSTWLWELTVGSVVFEMIGSLLLLRLELNKYERSSCVAGQ